MIYRPEILIVAGSGRNVGKSTLVCHIISKFRDLKPRSIKISPHFHQQPAEGQKYIIQEERDFHSLKDSSRFLRVGAGRVYFIQSHDDHLQDAFNALSDSLPAGEPLIVESGGLAKFVRPGLLIFVEGDEKKKNEDLRKNADLVLQMKQGIFDLSGIGFENGAWKQR